MAYQTYDTELAAVLEMIQRGEKSEAILRKIEQLAANSERDWMKELAEKAAQHQDTIGTFLLEAATSRTRRFLSQQFDVFLCYNDRDKAEVKEIGKQLKACRISPWLDEWEIPPGRPWIRLLEQQIAQIKSAAIFVSKYEIASWQREQLDALLRELIKRDRPVIPVFLRSAPDNAEPPIFLTNRTSVDFRKQDPDPMKQLIWGIKDER